MRSAAARHAGMRLPVSYGSRRHRSNIYCRTGSPVHASKQCLDERGKAWPFADGYSRTQQKSGCRKIQVNVVNVAPVNSTQIGHTAEPIVQVINKLATPAIGVECRNVGGRAEPSECVPHKYFHLSRSFLGEDSRGAQH